ncbi:MAG: response regulator [Nitrospinaceae bacterium]
MKALAIDDDREFLDLLGIYLKQIGYSTTAIYDAEGILTAITDENYNLVLVDWMMPEVDGITIIKAIRNRDRQTRHQTKVIMVTAIDNTMAKNYAKRSGADAFLPKSRSKDSFKISLFETIRSVMEENKSAV